MYQIMDLHTAVKQNDVAQVAKILQEGADVNQLDKFNHTPLHYANVDTAKLLLDADADVNARQTDRPSGDYGCTPLHYAAEDNNIELIKLLIAHGANVNMATERGWTALHMAYDNIDTIKVLLEAGADVNAQDHVHGNTVLHHQTDIEVVKLLIDAKVNVNLQNKRGKTALHYAVDEVPDPVHQRVESDPIKQLIDAGADLTLQDKDGFTVLHTAVSCGKMITVLLLVEQPSLSSYINLQDKHGYTALYLAVENQSMVIAEMLIVAGADVQIGPILLQYLRTNDDPDMVQAIIRNGADINFQDKDGDTPMHVAISNGNEWAVEMLIEEGVDINCPDREGCTPLHIAVSTGDCAIIKLVLNAKDCKVNARNKYNDTALHLVTNVEIATMLIDAGIDIDAQDNDGETVLHHCLMGEILDLAKMLIDRGANLDLANRIGITCRSLAVYHKLIEDTEQSLFECAVCLDEQSVSVRYTSKCNHEFCIKCIITWLKQNHTCPLCRTVIREVTAEHIELLHDFERLWVRFLQVNN